MKAAEPTQWRYEIDPGFDPEGEVPPFAVRGAWPLNGRGETVGDFLPNPGYVASPVALMLAVDEDVFTIAWAEHARFALDDSAFADVIRSVAWRGQTNEAGELLTFDAGQGPQVRVYSSDRHLEAAGMPSSARVRGSVLFDLAATGISVEANATATHTCFLSAHFLADIADA
ncbi:hypothetical protein [Curtobacterium flaccumfaciens]|uniref:hypothetical protein n=1 Tax=Curtobacterium flaccumfaciens TaxID=2035 RepID=UPI0024A8688A|nr:hypothetical protein [Curtobacterium flaccumfaciens]